MSLNSVAKLSLRVLVLCVLVLVAGCSDLGYYSQAVQGQLELIARRQPVQEMLKHEALPERLRHELSLAVRAREFAVSELLLPDNGTFRTYVDLQREAVTWNVVAAPSLNLAPVQWCFPVAGCVPYRGYFSKAEAEDFSEGLRRQGFDVYTYGVRAYSTLGWFDDPLLNTFLGRADWELVQLMFHELAHQVLYVQGDAFFNEAFAEAVAYEGVMRWLDRHGTEQERRDFLEAGRRSEAFVDLILEARKRLAGIYASDEPLPAKWAAKEDVIAWLRSSYLEMKERWGGYSGYDRWFASSLNNAKLASVGTYHLFVPAFRLMLVQAGGSLEKFYASVRALAELSPVERQRRVETLRHAALRDQAATEVF